jgi:hypothetical protein
VINGLKKIAWKACRSYNIRVPTPFYHLDIAENLLTNPALANPIRQLLQGQRDAFLLEIQPRMCVVVSPGASGDTL